MYRYFPNKELDHNDALLYGFHYVYIFIFTLVVFKELLFSNYINASVNATSLVLSVVSYYIFHVKNRRKTSIYMLIGIAVIPLIFLIYRNSFDNLPIIYFVILPLASFFLLELKEALGVTFLIYICVTLLLYVLYNENPDTPILNNHRALINLAFSSIIVMGFGLFYHLSIASTLKALFKSDKQKNILLKEIHHRVKNNLNVTASILSLQAEEKSDETQIELKKSKSRIESIAIVHDIIYKQDDYEKIDFNVYIDRLAKQILSMFTSEYNISLELKNNDNLSLPLHVMIQLGIITNEMLINTVKYANNNNGVVINIDLKKDDDTYTLFYKDNGQNEVDTEKILNASGLGLQLIQLSTQQLDGDFDVSYADGLKYKVEFKSV